MKSPASISVKKLDDVDTAYRQLRTDVADMAVREDAGVTGTVSVLTALPDTFSTLSFIKGRLVGIS